MNTRRLAAALLLAALTLTSGCLGALSGGTPAQADPAPGAAADGRTIEVAATGDVTAAPDQATVRVSVEARGDDAETARRRLAENVTRLRRGLADANVSGEQITTDGYDLRREHVRTESGPSDPTYVARQSFAITLSDTDRAGEIVDVAVGSGATSVDGVSVGLSEARRDEVKREAIAEAMNRTRDRAELIGQRADLTVTGVQSVSTTDVSTGPVQYEAAATADSGSTTIDSGPVTVSAEVRVVYGASA